MKKIMILPVVLALTACVTPPKKVDYYQLGQQSLQDSLDKNPDYQLCAKTARAMAESRIQKDEEMMHFYPVDHVAHQSMIDEINKKVSLNCYQGIDDRKAGKKDTSFEARKETLSAEEKLLHSKRQVTKGEFMFLEFQDIILRAYQMGYYNDSSF
ncbi:hypothetical protein ACLMYS_003912 [Salmonella enterica]